MATETTIVVREVELDLANADAVFASVAAEAGAAGAGRLVLSLPDLQFLDAYAIGRLIDFRADMTRSGRTVLLAAVNPAPRRVLTVTGLLDGFTHGA